MTHDSGKAATTTHVWPASAIHDLLNRPANQLPALDGLRAIAVLFVICDHWVYEWVTIAHHTEPALAKLPNFYWGWTGVDLFFVLSGFLIGKQLWNELYRTGTVSVAQFVLRRGLRIWPLYYACMLFLVVVQSPKAPSWPDWLMVSNYFEARYGRSWSLSTEEQFYLLMPTLLLAFRRFVPARWWPALIVLMLAFVSSARAITFSELSLRGLDPKTISTMMYSAFHLHCEPLLIGMLIAWASLRTTKMQPAETGTFAAKPFAAAVTLAIVGVALRTANREIFAYLALGCIYGAALCIALTDRSILSAILRWKIWYFIARLSFGMYLNHLILREPTDSIVRVVNAALGDNSNAAFIAGLLLTIAASAGMAAITFILIEQPGLELRDRWLSRRHAASAPTAVPAT